MIEPSEFETEIVGRPIYRVTEIGEESTLGAELSSCGHHIIAKLPQNERGAINLLIRSGFTFSCASSVMYRGDLMSHGASSRPAAPAMILRPLVESDLLAAFPISDSAFGSDNRYANDSVLAPYARAIHRQWLANSIQGYADFSIAAEIDGQVAGFATLHIRRPVASIGLLAVGASHRRAGLACVMTRRLALLAAADGCTGIQVVTESSNIGALNFYTSEGFVHSGAEISLYRLAR